MKLTRVERHLNAMNSVAKCKSKARSKQFRIDVLTDYIENPMEGMTEAEIEIFRQELQKVIQED